MIRQLFQHIPTDALPHWSRHDYILRVEIDPTDGVIRLHFRFPPRHPEYKDLIVDPLVEDLREQYSRLRPFLQRGNARFELVDPKITESPAANALSEEALREYQKDADTRFADAQERKMLQEARESQDLDESLKGQLRDAARHRNAGNAIEAAAIFEHVGEMLSRRRRYRGAARCLEDAAELFASVGDDKRAVAAYLAATDAHISSGHHLGFAQDTATKALDCATRLGNASARMDAEALLGRVYLLQGYQPQAYQCFDHVRQGIAEVKDA